MVGQRTAFISYRRTQFDRARLVRDGLRDRQIEAYLDVTELHAGRFDATLLDEIESREFFVPLLAPGSLDRCWRKGDWLWREMEHAYRARRIFVPVLSSDFDERELRRLTPPLADALRNSQRVRFGEADFFDDYVDRLANLINKAPQPGVATELGPPLDRPPRPRWHAVVVLGGILALLVAFFAVAWLADAWPFSSDPSPTTTTTTEGVSGDDALAPDEQLEAGDQLVTPDGRHSLTMTPSGRLLGRTGTFTWFSAPDPGNEVAGSVAYMGNDGNLVIYRTVGPNGPQDPIWSLQTQGNQNASIVIREEDGQGYFALVDPDGDEIERYPQSNGGPSSPDTEPSTETTSPGSTTTTSTSTTTTTSP